MTPLQPWTLFVPETLLTLLALLALLGGTVRKTDPRVLIRISILGCFLILCVLFSLWPVSGTALYGAFEVNPFVLFFKVIFTVTGIVTFLISQEYLKNLENRSADFIALILVALLGCFFLASSTDLITLFITIEWLTISLYVLTSYLRTDKHSLEAGTKYLIMGTFSSAIFLYGISFVYGTIGSLRFDQIASILSISKPDPLFFVGLLLVFVGIGFKISAFPFQLWVPDVYQGAPTPVTAFLTVAPKALGFAVLMRVLFIAFPQLIHKWAFLLTLLSILTMTIGNIIAISQSDVKRLLAYSSIAQAGYILVGLAVPGTLGSQAVLMYVVAYLFTNLGAFFTVLAIERHLGTNQLEAYNGLSERNPFLAFALTVFLLSLAGIPPLAGFIGKIYIFSSAISAHSVSIAVAIALNSALAAFYYFKVVKAMYLTAPSGSSIPFHNPLPIKIVVGVTLLGTFLIGIWPMQAIHFVEQTLASLSIF